MMPPSTPESLARNLAQAMLLVLLAEPDAATIAIPRHWLADWYATLMQIVALLERR